jgi:glutaminase
MPTHTGNPQINAGAIATTSLISGKTADEKWNKVLSFYSKVAGENISAPQGCLQIGGRYQHRQQGARYAPGQV